MKQSKEEILKATLPEDTYKTYLKIKTEKGQAKADKFIRRIEEGKFVYIKKEAPPHPFASYGTEEKVSRLNNFLQEEKADSMTIINPTNRPYKIIFRPNNYRRKLSISSRSDSTLEIIKKCYPSFSIGKRNKLIYIRLNDITLQYGVNTLTAIYSQLDEKGRKRFYQFEGEDLKADIKELDKHIDNIGLEILKTIDKALAEFINNTGITPNGLPVWDRYEDFIKGEDYIDKIPRDCIIHDTTFKKAYQEGIEFIQTPAKEAPQLHIKQYIKNRALEDFSPKIAAAIEEQGQGINKLEGTIETSLIPVLEKFTRQLELHLEVEREAKEALQEIKKAMVKKRNKAPKHSWYNSLG